MSCGLKSITSPKDRSIDQTPPLRFGPQLKIKLRFPITCPLAVLLPLRSLSDSQDRPVAPAPSVCWPSSVSTSYSSCGLHGPSPTCFSFHRPSSAQPPFQSRYLAKEEGSADRNSWAITRLESSLHIGRPCRTCRLVGRSHRIR